MATRVRYKTKCIPVEGVTEAIDGEPYTSWYLDSDCGVRPTSEPCTKDVLGLHNGDKEFIKDISTAILVASGGEDNGIYFYMYNSDDTASLLLAINGTNFTIVILPRASISFSATTMDINAIRVKASGGNVTATYLIGYDS